MNKTLVLAIAAALAAAAGAYAWHVHHASMPMDGKPGEAQVLYWYDPMKPEAHFNQPGKSPFMDMQLQPKYAASTGDNADTGVQVSPRTLQNFGIRSVKVERGAFSRKVDAAGAVEVDEHAVYAIESRAAGWVEQLLVRAVGEPVRKGQRVAGVYSPDLFAAQQELLLAVKSGDPALLTASRQRLQLLGLAPGQLVNLERSGQAQRQVAILAPDDGVVTELNVREGQQTMPGTPLMRIANLARVWVSVEIPEAQGSWVRTGQKAEARLQGLPGKVFPGTVEYVYPQLDSQTRTVRARLSFDNPGVVLKPGMFANVSLAGAQRDDVLLVPSEAVIRTGERTVVILSEGEGRFRPAAVRTGDERDGLTEILGGLNEGESIVVSGQFLIDSEASIRGALARMAPSPGEGHP